MVFILRQVYKNLNRKIFWDEMLPQDTSEFLAQFN